MNIYGKKTLIRAIEPSDLPLLAEMINDPDIESCVAGWSFPVSEYQQSRWLDSTLNDNKTKRFIIETTDKSENKAIGMIYLTDIDWKNRSVGTGIKLSSKAPRNQGYASDAVTALFGYTFDELQMHRIAFKIIETNVPSIKLYERVGAKREGVLRQSVYKNGRYVDQYCYAVLKSDFDEKRYAVEG